MNSGNLYIRCIAISCNKSKFSLLCAFEIHTLIYKEVHLQSGELAKMRRKMIETLEHHLCLLLQLSSSLKSNSLT